MEKIEKANKSNKKQIQKQIKSDIKHIKRKIKNNINSCEDKKIKKLIKSNAYKRYTKIYLKFGQEAYTKNVPKRIRRKDLKNLYAEDRFITIYEKHGEIKMFNSKTDNGMNIDRNIFGEELLCGLDMQNFPKEYFQSFLSTDLSEEELEKKYGVEAQNEALIKIRLKDEKNFINVIKQYYDNKGINVQEEFSNIGNKQNQNDDKENER